MKALKSHPQIERPRRINSRINLAKYTKKVFTYVDHTVFQMLWRWACRRHPNKGKRWIANKYFMPPRHPRWTFNSTD